MHRCNQWAELVERFDLMDSAPGVCHEHYGLCGVHFSREDFDGDELKDGAMPLRKQSPSTPATDAPQSGRARLTPDTRASAGRSPGPAATRVMAVAARAETITAEAVCALQQSADAASPYQGASVRAKAVAEGVARETPAGPGQTGPNHDVVKAAAAARAVTAAASDEAEPDGPWSEAEVASAAAVCLERLAYARFFPPPPPPPSGDAAFLAAEAAVGVTRDVFASASRADRAAAPDDNA